MALVVTADLHITVDGKQAHLEGDGQDLGLRLESPAMLRDLLAISLPNAQSLGTKVRSFSSVPKLLKGAGLTHTISDSKGDILILGKGAEGKRYTLPFVGKLENVVLANKRAALRLALDR